MPLKAITFDVGGTLATGKLNKELYGQHLLELLESHGQRVSRRELKRAVGLAVDTLNRLREKNLEMDFNEFRRLTLLRLGITPTPELLSSMASLYYKCFEQEPVPKCREVLEELSKNYMLGVISNTMSLASKVFLEKFNLAGYFRVQVYSGEVGYRKPHPKIFQIALERLGVLASEAVHVGNDSREDVKGPKKVGMKAILVGSHDPEADLVVGSLAEVPAAVYKLSSTT
jgi:putative hydrolase of the HAD superfamily